MDEKQESTRFEIEKKTIPVRFYEVRFSKKMWKIDFEEKLATYQFYLKIFRTILAKKGQKLIKIDFSRNLVKINFDKKLTKFTFIQLFSYITQYFQFWMR